MLFEYLLAISTLLTGTLIILLIHAIPQWDEGLYQDKGSPATLIITLAVVWVLSLLACAGVLALTGIPLGPI
jgi:hypothetical protein